MGEITDDPAALHGTSLTGYAPSGTFTFQDRDLHVRCPYRITRNGRLLAGSGDPARFASAAARILAATASDPLIVHGTDVTTAGDLHVHLSDGVTVELFRATTGPAWTIADR